MGWQRHVTLASISGGASVTQRRGETPLNVAVKNDKKSIAAYLRQAAERR
jgi:hypothetical protein